MNEAIIHNLLKGKVVSKITIGSVCVGGGGGVADVFYGTRLNIICITNPKIH